MKTLQTLLSKNLSPTAREALDAMTQAAKRMFSVTACGELSGTPDVLLLWGIGAAHQAAAAKKQLYRGGRVVMLDMGYHKDKPGRNRMFRVSIDEPHPQRLLDETPDALCKNWLPRVEEKPNLGSRVLLVDMGPKAVSQYELNDWARLKATELESRGIPRSDMLHRPKPKRPFIPVPGVAHDAASSIDTLLRRSRLVVTHHSNVGVEAVMAGVPLETEDGAAFWMRGKEWTYENRVSFINRLSHWQYRPTQAAEAWTFLERFLK